MDPGGTVRTWNLGGKRIHGYAADEIIGHHFSRFYPPKVVERGTPSLELELARIDGQYQAEEWRGGQGGGGVWAGGALKPPSRRERGMGWVCPAPPTPHAPVRSRAK